VKAWPYGFAALTISFAGYEGEVMRGAFAGVPRGELEAARAYGMSPWTLFRPRLAAARPCNGRWPTLKRRNSAAVEVERPLFGDDNGRGSLWRGLSKIRQDYVPDL